MNALGQAQGERCYYQLIVY